MILPHKKRNSLFSLCSVKTNCIICLSGNEFYWKQSQHWNKFFMSLCSRFKLDHLIWHSGWEDMTDAISSQSDCPFKYSQLLNHDPISWILRNHWRTIKWGMEREATPYCSGARIGWVSRAPRPAIDSAILLQNWWMSHKVSVYGSLKWDYRFLSPGGRPVCRVGRGRT